MAKYCTNCGNELKEDAAFCSECGVNVVDQCFEVTDKTEEKKSIFEM